MFFRRCSRLQASGRGVHTPATRRWDLEDKSARRFQMDRSGGKRWMPVGRRQMSWLALAAADAVNRKWILLLDVHPAGRREQETIIIRTTLWRHPRRWRHVLRWRRRLRNVPPMVNQRGLRNACTSTSNWTDHIRTWAEAIQRVVRPTPTSHDRPRTGAIKDDGPSRWFWSVKMMSMICFNQSASTETVSPCYKHAPGRSTLYQQHCSNLAPFWSTPATS